MPEMNYPLPPGPRRSLDAPNVLDLTWFLVREQIEKDPKGLLNRLCDIEDLRVEHRLYGSFLPRFTDAELEDVRLLFIQEAQTLPLRILADYLPFDQNVTGILDIHELCCAFIGDGNGLSVEEETRTVREALFLLFLFDAFQNAR